MLRIVLVKDVNEREFLLKAESADSYRLLRYVISKKLRNEKNQEKIYTFVDAINKKTSAVDMF